MRRIGHRCAAAAPVLVVLLALACRGPYADLAPEQREIAEAGRKVYDTQACERCHGELREGQRTAPPLTGLAPHWDEEGLIGYLRNPDEVRGHHARLLQLGDTYSLKMPAIRGSDEDLSALARYLLLDPPEK